MWALEHYFEIYARQYRRQLEEEARQCRLAHRYGTMPAWHHAVYRALGWWGQRMARWGARLWARYGDAPPSPQPGSCITSPRDATSAR